MDVFGYFQVSEWLVVVCLALTAIYTYFTWTFGYFENQNVGLPVVKPWPILGSLSLQILKKPLHEIDEKLVRKYGNFFGGYESRRPFLTVSDPDLLRLVLVKDFAVFPNRRHFELSKADQVLSKFLSILRDEEWKQVRNIITPSFTSGKLKQMTYLIDDACQELVTELDKVAKPDQIFDPKIWFGALTMDVIATCAFGTQINSIKNPDDTFIKNARRVFGSVPIVMMLISMIFPKLLKYIPVGFFPKDAMDYFSHTIRDVIDIRAQDSEKRRDFLQFLLDGQVTDTGANEDTTGKTQDGTKNAPIKKGLDFDMILSQCVLFLLAGHETTATTLAFTAYSLAVNPDVQDKLLEEIDRMVEENEGKFPYESVMKLPYLEMVISETLRMYPPASRLERACEVEGYMLGGVRMQKRMVVIVPVYSIHHDPELYPDPETFDPERFSPEMKADRNPFTYLPFGSGPRNCVGLRFALLEAKLALCHVLRQFRFATCPETKIPIEFKSGAQLLAAKEMNIRLEKRTNKD